MIPVFENDPISFWRFIGHNLTVLWKDWPKDMRVSGIHPGTGGFVLNGECPHCQKLAAFQTVAPVHHESPDGYENRMIGIARCIACNNYILAMIKLTKIAGNMHWVYGFHYPVGVPNDSVDKDIPPAIGADLSEAIRCNGVKAYNATIEMCRRALEGSCINLGANKDEVLNKMIEQLYKEGKITKLLRDVAHKIKLGGNRAAHVSDKTLTAKDADAIIEFTKEWMRHIYVTPARMGELDYEKPK